MKEANEEREKIIKRFWLERAVYIAIIIVSVSILLTIISYNDELNEGKSL